jgi:hypothetical protein
LGARVLCPWDNILKSLGYFPERREQLRKCTFLTRRITHFAVVYRGQGKIQHNLFITNINVPSMVRFISGE